MGKDKVGRGWIRPDLNDEDYRNLVRAAVEDAMPPGFTWYSMTAGVPDRVKVKEPNIMGKRIVTTDVEIIAAVIEAITDRPYDQVNLAAHDVVHILTKPPEKPSDITGFEDDDAEDIE